LVLLWLSWELPEVLLARASWGWLVVEGTIERCFVDVKQESDSEGSWYHPKVEYRYKVAGRWYQAKKLWFGYPWTSDYGEAANALAGYIKGGNVSVYYDPKNLNRSVLIREVQPITIWLIVIQLGALGWIAFT
jgi:Protein of unknown function (DUF3592)